MASLKTRGFVALDGMTHWDALALAARLRGLVYGVKVEHLLYGSMSSLELICRLKDMGFKVFADAKLHSTPPAVTASVQALAQSGADLVSVHVSGGSDMVKAAVEAYRDVGVRDVRKDEAGMGILAITVLTSFSREESLSTYHRTVLTNVRAFANIARANGVYGIVCGPYDTPHLRSDPRLAFVTPGIRLDPSRPGRHQRYGPPAHALANGATFLVIGDDITNRAYDPIERVRLIDESIASLPE
jgi:orotidine-5'-phosphate decarboxylase